MNEMQVFQSNEFGEMRIVKHNGEPWFVAADVCRVLEIQNPTHALTRLDDDEKASLKLGLSGGDTNIINEPGLYSLVLGSRKPEARAFKRWITHEVLPRIRRYGMYVSDAAINDTDMVNGEAKREQAALPDKACEEFVSGVWDMVESGKWRVIELSVSEYSDDEDMIGFIDGEYLYAMPQRAYERTLAQRREAGEVFPLTKRMLFKSLRNKLADASAGRHVCAAHIRRAHKGQD